MKKTIVDEIRQDLKHVPEFDGPAGPWIWLATLRDAGDTILGLLHDKTRGINEIEHHVRVEGWLRHLIAVALTVPAPDRDFLDQPFDFNELVDRELEGDIAEWDLLEQALSATLSLTNNQMLAHNKTDEFINKNVIVTETAARWAARVIGIAVQMLEASSERAVNA